MNPGVSSESWHAQVRSAAQTSSTGRGTCGRHDYHEPVGAKRWGPKAIRSENAVSGRPRPSAASCAALCTAASMRLPHPSITSAQSLKPVPTPRSRAGSISRSSPETTLSPGVAGPNLINHGCYMTLALAKEFKHRIKFDIIATAHCIAPGEAVAGRRHQSVIGLVWF